MLPVEDPMNRVRQWLRQTDLMNQESVEQEPVEQEHAYPWIGPDGDDDEQSLDDSFQA